MTGGNTNHCTNKENMYVIDSLPVRESNPGFGWSSVSAFGSEAFLKLFLAIVEISTRDHDAKARGVEARGVVAMPRSSRRRRRRLRAGGRAGGDGGSFVTSSVVRVPVEAETPAGCAYRHDEAKTRQKKEDTPA